MLKAGETRFTPSNPVLQNHLFACVINSSPPPFSKPIQRKACSCWILTLLTHSKVVGGEAVPAPAGEGWAEVAPALGEPVDHLTELVFAWWNSTRSGEIRFFKAFWKFCMDPAGGLKETNLEFLNSKVSLRWKSSFLSLEVWY